MEKSKKQKYAKESEEEINLTDIWRTIVKRKKTIISITLTIIILVTLFSLFSVKIYESESTISIAKIEGKEIFTAAEAKNIILGSAVLMPVIEEYFSEEEKPSLKEFREDNIEVKIVVEGIDYGNKEITNFLNVKLKANGKVLSRDMALSVVNNFFNYTNEEFNKQKDVILQEYDAAKNSIEKQLIETEEKIKRYEDNVASTENEINSLTNTQMSGEGISKSTLLKDILANYRDNLETEKSKKIDLENQLETIKLNLQKRLIGTEESKMISQPQIPKFSSGQSTKKNAFLALIIGLFISILFVLFQETLKKGEK
jgi:capsular polysaccharide biosynthesis protein